MPLLKDNEVIPTPPRNPSALRWAIGALMALPIVVGAWLALTFVVWTYTAVAWNGLRVTLGF